MHEDQVAIDVEIVRRLVVDQFPQWSSLSIRPVASAATVNAIFRIGDSLAARFPLRAGDPAKVRAWLSAEADAAREFADVATVQAPDPVALGDPGHGFPLPWAVQTWLPGRDALLEDPAGSLPFAEDLARLIAALRAAPTRGRAFGGSGRGGHLPDHDEWMNLCFTRSEGLLDVPRLRAMWDELRTLREVDSDVMCHGDLTPPNVLVGEGRLVGVLDTGGFAAADPALDLVSVWHLLDNRSQRDIVRRQLECSDTQWQRGMAWALQQGMGLAWYYADTNPAMSRWGRRTLDRLLAVGDSC